MVLLSVSPSISLSRMFFWLHSSLHVLVSSLRATRKSSKVSPSCSTCLRKFFCFDCFIQLALYVLFDGLDDVFHYSAPSPKLSTVETVS